MLRWRISRLFGQQLLVQVILWKAVAMDYENLQKIGGACETSKECLTGSFCASDCFKKPCDFPSNVCQPCSECSVDEDRVRGDGTCCSLCGVCKVGEIGAACEKSKECLTGSFCAGECFKKPCAFPSNVCQPCSECKVDEDAVDGTCCSVCGVCNENDGTKQGSESTKQGSERKEDESADEEQEDTSAFDAEWDQLLMNVDGAIASREDREACPHYQHMQCFLDTLEKTCEDDVKAPLELLSWSAQESVWICCCPFPYMPCERSDMNKQCLEAVAVHLSEARVTTHGAMVEGLQKARGSLLRAGGDACTALSAEEPISACGSQGGATATRSLDRQDLFCEMVTWQWEELGDGNPDEFKRNGCEFDKAMRGKAPARKGGSLTGGQGGSQGGKDEL